MREKACDAEYTMDFDRNRITGTLPTQVGQLHGLRAGFGLTGNRTSGYLPTELGQLTELRSFSVESNAISGTVP